MTNLKTTIVGQFSALNNTDAGRAACLEYDTAVKLGASSDQAEVQASNVLQRAGFDVNRHGGASFKTSASALEEAIEEASRVEPSSAADVDWHRAWARNARAALQALDDDADQKHIISAILGEDAIELSFDPVRPESPVFYRYPDVSEEWQSCPFQSADVRHLSHEAACAMVNNWVG